MIPPRDNRLTLYVLTSTGNGLPLPAENRTDLPDSPPGNETVEISTGGGCVQTGPFSEASGFEVTMGPDNSTEYNPRCLRRGAPLLLNPRPSLLRIAVPTSFSTFRTRTDFDFAGLQAGNRTSIEDCLARKTYASFHRCAEGGFGIVGEDPSSPHMSGHQAVGAGASLLSKRLPYDMTGGLVGSSYFSEVSSVFPSPGDPIFWLHRQSTPFSSPLFSPLLTSSSRATIQTPTSTGSGGVSNIRTPRTCWRWATMCCRGTSRSERASCVSFQTLACSFLILERLTLIRVFVCFSPDNAE